MNSPENVVLRIGAWRVDPALDEIYKDGETTKLEPRTMRLLVCLAEHAGQVVSVEQLLDQVWKDVIVTPNSVYHAVATLRRTLGDDTKEPTYIANVLRRGYRLVAPVARWEEATAVPEGNAKPIPSADPEDTPEGLKPTVAVESHHSIRKLTGRRLGRAIMVVLVLGIAYLLLDRLWLSKRLGTEAQTTSAAAVINDKSIAVLPFVDKIRSTSPMAWPRKFSTSWPRCQASELSAVPPPSSSRARARIYGRSEAPSALPISSKAVYVNPVSRYV
jgi:transcriptional activator of cad operon